MATVIERVSDPATTRPDRIGGVAGAAAGAAFVVLILVGNTVFEEGGNPTLGIALELAGFAALAGFVAHVFTTLRARPGWATLALVGGITVLGVKLASAAPFLAAQQADLAPEAAAALIEINASAFVVSWFPHGLFVVGLALGAMRNPLPRGVAWAGVVIGAGCLAAVAVPAAEPFVLPFLLSLLWLIVASVLLVRAALRSQRAWTVEV